MFSMFSVSFKISTSILGTWPSDQLHLFQALFRVTWCQRTRISWSSSWAKQNRLRRSHGRSTAASELESPGPRASWSSATTRMSQMATRFEKRGWFGCHVCSTEKNIYIYIVYIYRVYVYIYIHIYIIAMGCLALKMTADFFLKCSLWEKSFVWRKTSFSVFFGFEPEVLQKDIPKTARCKGCSSFGHSAVQEVCALYPIQRGWTPVERWVWGISSCLHHFGSWMVFRYTLWVFYFFGRKDG